MSAFNIGDTVEYKKKGEYCGDTGILLGINYKHPYPFKVKWLTGVHKFESEYRYTTKFIKVVKCQPKPTVSCQYKLIPRKFELLDLIQAEACGNELKVYIDLIGYLTINDDNFDWFMNLAEKQNNWVQWLIDNDFVSRKERMYGVGDCFKVFGITSEAYCMLVVTSNYVCSLVNLETGLTYSNNALTINTASNAISEGNLSYLAGNVDSIKYIIGGIGGVAYEIT